MSRNICYICDFNEYHGGQCDLCHKKCDKCQVCRNVFNAHNEIFDLSSEFSNKVYDSYRDIEQKAKEVSEYLKNNYSIYINFSSGEDFLSRLEDKKRELDRNHTYLENKIYYEGNEHSNKMREIVLKYESDKELMNQKFQIEKNKYIYKKDGKIIKDKKKIIKKLKVEKNSINKNKDEIINNYIKEEREKAINIFNNQKAEIQEPNANKEKELKYSEEENNLKNEYSKNILKIKELADKIPCYDNFIIQTGLNKYLN